MKKEIKEYSQKLNLPVIADRWSELAEQASKDNVPYSQFLFSLLELEITENTGKNEENPAEVCKVSLSKNDRSI